MGWRDLATGFFGGGFVVAITQILLSHRLSIRQDKAAEKRHKQQRIRESSVAVAEVIGEWVRPSHTRDGGRPTGEDLWRIQTTYWRAMLWLDEELLKKLAELMAGAYGGPTTNQMLVEARRALLGAENTQIQSEETPTWLPSSGSTSAGDCRDTGQLRSGLS
jgi:hypothetical protein